MLQTADPLAKFRERRR